jgi:hypothetical protein
MESEVPLVRYRFQLHQLLALAIYLTSLYNSLLVYKERIKSYEAYKVLSTNSCRVVVGTELSETVTDSFDRLLLSQ